VERREPPSDIYLKIIHQVPSPKSIPFIKFELISCRIELLIAIDGGAHRSELRTVGVILQFHNCRL
jgi:hypothetical protein